MMETPELLTAILLRNRKGFATLDALTRDLYESRTTIGVAIGSATRSGLVRQTFGPSAGGYWYELTDRGRDALKRRAA